MRLILSLCLNPTKMRRVIKSNEEALHFFKTRQAPLFCEENVNICENLSFVNVDFAFRNLSFTQFSNCLFRNCNLNFAYMWYNNFFSCDIINSDWTDSYSGGSVTMAQNNGEFIKKSYSSGDVLKIPPRQWHNYPLMYITGYEVIYCQCLIAKSIGEFEYEMTKGKWWPSDLLQQTVHDFISFKQKRRIDDKISISK